MHLCHMSAHGRSLPDNESKKTHEIDEDCDKRPCLKSWKLHAAVIAGEDSDLPDA